MDGSFLLLCSQDARLTGLPPSQGSGAKGSSAGPTPSAPPGPASWEDPYLLWHNLHPLSWLSQHRQRLGKFGGAVSSPLPVPKNWEMWGPPAPRAPSLCVYALSCWYKCGSMFSESCVPSARCDISWKEFQRALCKVLNKLLNKTEPVSAEAK